VDVIVITCKQSDWRHWYSGRCRRADFCSVLFSSLLLCSVLLCSVQFSSVQFSSVQFGSVQFSSAEFSSVHFSSVLFSSVQFCLDITIMFKLLIRLMHALKKSLSETQSDVLWSVVMRLLCVWSGWN